ncbi:hypothetical protein [Caulobacter endophyticus]|uniref:hypothetical protein n=1 Tax=Caulobacter endophyticus TaxID=2172652 RepID=UPI00240FEC8C|nr:hypothetical protein [Caulobacter endophyticus]MDG2529394.1 hypothetical protein [Caulobacter endophyticus]
MAANLLLIGLLSLVERETPLSEIPPMLFEIDRLEDEPLPAEKRASAKAASSAARSHKASSRPAAQSGAIAASGEGEAAPTAGPDAPAIDPAWKVDPKAVDRWKLTEGNPKFRWGRYQRACQGLSSEHLTDEEKDRCWGGFAAKAPPTELGPSGRRGPRPPSRFDAQARQQERCRGYRGSITPGSKSGSVLGFGGVADPPRLRDGGC